MKKPIYEKSIKAESRLYFLDVFRDKQGQKYAVISEKLNLPNHPPKGKSVRQRIFIHSDHIEKFLEAVSEISKAMKYDFSK